MRRSLVALLAAASLAVAFVAPASGGTAVMVGGVPLVGPMGVVWCTDATPFFPGQVDNGTQAGPGTVSMAGGDFAVSAAVTLRGAAPYHAYYVRLIQGGSVPTDCWTLDGVIVTDAWGNGITSVREARRPGTVAITVIVDSDACLCSLPIYRAKSRLVLGPGAFVLGPDAVRRAPAGVSSLR